MPRAAIIRSVLTAVLAVACLSSGYALGLRDSAGSGSLLRPAAPAQLSDADQRAFGVVWEALTELERNYYQPDRLDAHTLADAAAKGMVQAVGDPYTTLTDPHQADLTESQLRGSFDGIGIEVDRRDGQLTVVSPFAGSPAESAGVRAGDTIVVVDGQEVTQLNLDDVAGRIRGPRGTTVTLRLMRSGAPIELAIVRAPIKVESVSSRLLEGDVPLAYLRISIFSEPTGQQLRTQLSPLLRQGVKGVVLDLRGNPGGYLTSAVDVSSAFLRDGVVLYQARSETDSNRHAYRTNGSPQAPDLPIVVLVDRGSASAAEIVAAALRDNKRGVLVGEKSFGKGTVQELHTLSDDSQLKLTVAQWLTPQGVAIQGQGLAPDIEVAAVDGQDAPLDAAQQYLRQGAAHG
jgi:carboxyl-terminal processing protease